MNFEGYTYGVSGDIANLQAQIDALDAEVTIIQGQITTLLSSVGKLSNSATGNFSNFVMSSTGAAVVLSDSMPLFGTYRPLTKCFVIPTDQITVGMGIRVTLFAEIQIASNPANTQTMAVYLSADANGGYPMTPLDQVLVLDTTAYAGAVLKSKIVFDLILKSNTVSTPMSVFGAVSYPFGIGGNSGAYLYQTADVPSSNIQNGFRVFILGQFASPLLAGTHNLGIYDVVIERTALF